MSHLSPLLKQACGVLADRGEGSYLFDTEGRRYIDFTSGIGVTATGHCHPRVVAAAQAQVAKLVHAQYTTVKHQPMLDLSDRLGTAFAGEFLNDVVEPVRHAADDHGSAGGSDAVEMALRLARHATKRANIIAFNGGFHGRTMAAASMTTSTTKIRTGFHPMMAGVVIAPFPHMYRYGWDEGEATRFCLQELDNIFVTQSAPEDTAAMIVEPVQGEFGYYPATAGFMQGLRERCDRYGILLIGDEIQAGFGRTGKFWSHQHFGVTPDIITTAKGLASGFPVSAMAASEALMAKGLPGSQGGTYGANAVACAAALANIDVIEDENLVDNAQARGEYLHQRLEALRNEHDCIAEIRGMGLMLGMEIARGPRQPDGARAEALVKAAEAEGLLLLRCGTHGQIVRWLPPLIVSDDLIDAAVEAFGQAIAKVA